MKGRVLLVDDEPSVLSGLRRALGFAGYDVLVAEDGETALSLAAEHEPDIVVLDVVLPGLDGLRVCERLRAASEMPILMLTAKDTVPDRVAGLDHGADDYLVKPFAVDELLARMRALLRRGHAKEDNRLTFGDLSIDLQARQAFRSGELLKLTPREYELLALFMHHPRQALSRDQLCQQVWGYAFDGESNFVDVAVHELRRKLEADGYPRRIQTVRSYGYALREA